RRRIRGIRPRVEMRADLAAARLLPPAQPLEPRRLHDLPGAQVHRRDPVAPAKLLEAIDELEVLHLDLPLRVPPLVVGFGVDRDDDLHAPYFSQSRGSFA